MYDFAHSRGAKFLLVFQPELGNKKIPSEDEKKLLEIWSSQFGYLDRKIPERYKLLRGCCGVRGAKKIWCSPANTLRKEKPVLRLGFQQPDLIGGLAYEATQSLGATVSQCEVPALQAYG